MSADSLRHFAASGTACAKVAVLVQHVANIVGGRSLMGQTRLMSIKVSVQAQPRDIDSWVGLARRLESIGFDALLAAIILARAPRPGPHWVRRRP